MSETLVVGIIADTSNPAAAARLLGDLGRLAEEDPGLSRVEVVVLENPSEEPAPHATRNLSVDGLDVHCIGRASQERDAARGCFGAMELPPGRLPIAIARTLVQRHTFERASGENTAVWILDEDLRLQPLLKALEKGEPPLSERVKRLRLERIDVALGPVLGAPSLPARSTVRVNLEDVWRHLGMVAMLEPEAPWPDRAAENTRVRQAFPEYYYDLSRAHADAGAQPMWLERADAGETVRSAFSRLASALGALIDGAPITRTIPESAALDASNSPLARGGNTLVLRPALLGRIPNLAPRIGERVSRRSDMLWARLSVALEGARFTRAPIPALQDRSGPGRSSFEVDKLLDDVRGSAVVAALDALADEGALAGNQPLSRGAVTRACEVYVTRARERLAAVHRSEERARSLLEQIIARASDEPSGFLGHPAHVASREELCRHAVRLQAAYGSRFKANDPLVEQTDVERFFLGLGESLAAYRAGASSTRLQGAVCQVT